MKKSYWGMVTRAATEEFRTLKENMAVVGRWTNRDQIKAELTMAIDFFQFADASGLPLPEDSQKLRRVLKKAGDDLRTLKDDEGRFLWPPEDVWSLLALAQHYGVPTRLLDWTRNSYTAAYFAAIGAAKILANQREELPMYLSVWAFNIDTFDVSATLAPPFGNPERLACIKIVTVPRASNPNLHAQKGIFTLHIPENFSPTAAVDRRPLDQIIHAVPTNNRLIRFRLPAEKAGELLRLLSFEGITGASIYAGYRGAAEATMERRYWDSDVNLSPFGELP